MTEQDSAQMGKKREKVEGTRNGDAKKGIPQHIPKKMANQELSKRIRAERRKE